MVERDLGAATSDLRLLEDDYRVIGRVLDNALHDSSVPAGLSTQEAADAGCRQCQALLALDRLFSEATRGR